MVRLRLLDGDEARRELAGTKGIIWSEGSPTAEDVEVLGIAAQDVPTWLIVDGDGACVGMCGTHEPLQSGCTPEIGYHVAPTARGGGVATRAVALLLDEIRRAGAAGVVAEVDRTSAFREASLAVLGANGFARLSEQVTQQLFADPVDGAELLHRWLH